MSAAARNLQDASARVAAAQQHSSLSRALMEQVECRRWPPTHNSAHDSARCIAQDQAASTLNRKLATSIKILQSNYLRSKARHSQQKPCE